MIAFSFQIDPHLVLGVPSGATLQEIRDAYRQQAKKFHPDTGGAEWAFRVLVQAYEMLCTARVELASRNESRARSSTASAAAAGTWGSTSASASARAEDESGGATATASATATATATETDDAVDPARVVGVERLSVRYEAEPLWLVAEASREEHSLSCSLNFRWPDPAATVDPNSGESERFLARLAEVFEAMCLKTQVVTSRIRLHENSFSGWLSYPSLERASAAYRLLHGMLQTHGFAVKPWNRDLVIPRTWR